MSQWTKSTHSTTDVTCLEVSPRWVKSSRSANQGQCVEASRPTDQVVAVRDSKEQHPGGTVLVFTGNEWTTFVEGVKGGDFD